MTCCHSDDEYTTIENFYLPPLLTVLDMRIKLLSFVTHLNIDNLNQIIRDIVHSSPRLTTLKLGIKLVCSALDCHRLENEINFLPLMQLQCLTHLSVSCRDTSTAIVQPRIQSLFYVIQHLRTIQTLELFTYNPNEHYMNDLEVDILKHLTLTPPTHITHLNLNHTYLDDEKIALLQKMPNLTSITPYAFHTETFDFMKAFPHCTKFGAYAPEMSISNFCTNLMTLSQLTDLQMMSECSSADLKRILAHLPLLQILHLLYCDSLETLDVFPKKSKIGSITIEECNLKHEELASLASLPHLTHLYVYDLPYFISPELYKALCVPSTLLPTLTQCVIIKGGEAPLTP